MAARSNLAKVQKSTRAILAANLRRERHRLGLSQEKAAEQVEFSLQYVQRIERMVVNVPLDTLVRFAYAYGVEPADLLRQPR